MQFKYPNLSLASFFLLVISLVSVLLLLQFSLFSQEVDKSKVMNELLGVGIGVFQGLANLAINGLVLVVLYAGGSLLATDQIKPGDLMSFLAATQTVQRYFQELIKKTL